jgi:superfamily II DNA or RNA helicase
MPRGIYSEISCNKGKHPEFTPQKHQTEVVDYFLNKSKFKGLVLFHRLGSGKSCSSIMTSDAMLKEAKVKKIYVMTPGSLRQNFIEEYCDRCGYKPKYLKKYYTFITTNYTVGDRLPDLNDSLVIIDEVHNLINGVKNQSKNSTLIYNGLLKSNCRVLALTGTPVFNSIWEWPLLGNLLKPGTFSDIIRHKKLDKEVFMLKFKIDKDGNVKPKNKRFSVNLRGIISYFPGVSGDDYPTVIHENPIRTRMTIPQDNLYWHKEYNERKSRCNGPPSRSLLHKSPAEYYEKLEFFIMASKYILTRKVSNFFYTPDIESTSNPSTRDEVSHIGKTTMYIYKPTSEISPQIEYFEDMIRSRIIKEKDQKTIDYNKVKKEVKKEISQDVMKTSQMGNIGWVNSDNLKNNMLTDVYSRKITAVIVNILKNWKAKHMVFSFFKNKSGVNIIHALLKKCGINTSIYSGDISDNKRRMILKEFNSEKNRYGDNIKAILVTEAGAEGINLLETQHMHILESSTREMKIQQAIGRVVRYRSHKVEGRTPMPKHEQAVHIWRYWSISDKAPVTITINKKGKKETITYTDKTTVDEVLYYEGLIKLNIMNSFLKLLKKASVTKYDKSIDKNIDMFNYRLLPENKNLIESYKKSDERYVKEQAYRNRFSE